MKKTFFITLSLVFSFAWVSAQSCLPDGINFTSQSQIDSFQIIHPNCSEIEGTVTIDGDDINNLDALSVLTSIEGSLWIHHNIALNSLAGLSNLNFIGGSLSLIENSALESLTGLEGVTSTGDFLYMSNNDVLNSLLGLDNLAAIGGDLSIVSNDLLSDLNEFGNVSSIMGRIFIGGNDSLKSLSGLENITTIPGELRLVANGTLSSLTGLDNLSHIGENILIWNNDALTNLGALENVTSIEGWLSIVKNDVLNSLAGLDNIESSTIVALEIAENFVLSTCEVLSVCEYLAIPGDSVDIRDNAIGCNSQEEVEDACVGVGLAENIIDEIKIFPNPATHTVTIAAANRSVETAIIYSPTGQLVHKQRPENNVIDVSAIRPGMYILELTMGNTRVSKKLYIQR